MAGINCYCWVYDNNGYPRDFNFPVGVDIGQKAYRDEM